MPRPPGLRAATDADLARILELNALHERETSPLTIVALRHLVATSFATMVVDHGDQAFMIALDQDADYASPNFLWFRDRLDRFVYVDRIIVAAAARGRKYAHSLYLALFDAARNAGHDRIVCEVNLDPPNPGSDAFHAALGFSEIGQASIHGGSKTVRYLSRAV